MVSDIEQEDKAIESIFFCFLTLKHDEILKVGIWWWWWGGGGEGSGYDLSL